MFKINSTMVSARSNNDLADIREKNKFGYFINVCGSDMVVRVWKVDEPKKLGKPKSLFFKFIVDNGKKLRIQCIAVEDQIERIKPLVKKNTIICIKGATSKRERDPMFNGGDVPFVLMIYSNTTITVIGDCVPENETDGEPMQKNRDMTF